MTKDEKFNVVVNHAFGGWHHVRGKKAFHGAVKFHVYCGGLATTDFDQLTKFVIACHAVRVRGEIVQSGPGLVGFILSERSHQPNSWSENHPDARDLSAMALTLQARVDGWEAEGK